MIRRFKTAILFLFTILSFGIAVAQERKEFYNFWNESMQQLALPSSNERWIDIHPDAKVTTETFFIEYANALGLGPNDDMRLLNLIQDTLGYKHYIYRQYFNNIRIEDGQYHLHKNKEGIHYAANGTLIRNMNKSDMAVISKPEALQKAFEKVQAGKYLWEVEEMENRLRMDHHKDTSYYPLGELIWTNLNSPMDKESKYVLAYVFEIHCYQPLTSRKVYVSALDGIVLKDETMEQSCGYATHGTVYNGNQTVGVTTGYVQLYNDCINIRTSDWNNECTASLNNQDISPGASWTSSQELALGMQTHWGLDKSYYYFLNKFSRNGYDGSQGGIQAYINAYFSGSSAFAFGCWCSGTNSNNASFNPSTGVCLVGHGCEYVGNSDSYGALDIVAHEFAHGVTGHNGSQGLTYSYESGALNESFSDIFGECVEKHATGSNNWLIGYERSDGAAIHFTLRSMSNPGSYNHPSTYGGTYWYTGSDDNGGVHTNSGVQNKMFYLLAMAIGMADAENIAYRALTSGYYVPASNYADSRRAWIRAAVDLFGTCSYQVAQTMSAWTTVGVLQQTAPAAAGVCGTWPDSATSWHSFSNYQIQSPPLTGCTSNTTIINTSAATYFKGDDITLRPGFHAQQGSNFIALIECPFPY